MILSAPTSIRSAIILSESTSGTYLDGNAFSPLIGFAGFLLLRARCCHGFGCGCAAVFASSICLGCQLGGKCCDSTHFLSRGWEGWRHPSCCHSSVSSLAHVNTIRDSSSDTWLDSKEDCCLGLDVLHQFEGKIMLGKLKRFS